MPPDTFTHLLTQPPPLSDDPVIPTKGLSAKRSTASHLAGRSPVLTLSFIETSLRFCCAAKMVTASEARELARVHRATRDATDPP